MIPASSFCPFIMLCQVIGPVLFHRQVVYTSYTLVRLRFADTANCYQFSLTVVVIFKQPNKTFSLNNPRNTVALKNNGVKSFPLGQWGRNRKPEERGMKNIERKIIKKILGLRKTCDT